MKLSTVFRAYQKAESMAALADSALDLFEYLDGESSPSACAMRSMSLHRDRQCDKFAAYVARSHLTRLGWTSSAGGVSRMFGWRVYAWADWPDAPPVED